MAQIMGSLLSLGAIGWLYPYPVILLNGGLLVYLMSRTPSWPVDNINPGIKREIFVCTPNKVIFVLIIIVIGWLFVNAYFLPPRGVDDIAYHLPVVFDSIQHGRWVFLPTSLYIQFAYPLNAETLFAWPVLLMGDTRWVDAMVIPVGIWTAGVIYLFLRNFAVRRAGAFFVAGMFLLTPIVIAQMGTNYIDVICAGFLLNSLYLFLRSCVSTKKIYLRLAYLSIACMIGMKYHLLILGLPLALMLMFNTWRKKEYREFFSGFIIILLGMGWYFRNYIVFGDGLYPAQRTIEISWHIQKCSLNDLFGITGQKLNMLFLKCPNIGSYDGGFGSIYGVIIFFLFLILGWRFLFRKRRWIKGDILLYGLPLVIGGIIFFIGKEAFFWIGPRMFLVIWPIMMIFAGRILFGIKGNVYLQRIWMICCLAGFLLDAPAVLNSRQPHHHWWGMKGQSEFEFYQYALWYEKRLGPVAGALDEITQSLRRPATAFLASCEPFFSAPFYGRFLQTRIINFDPDVKQEPDFLVYVTHSPSRLVYVGTYQKTLEEAMSSKYIKVFDHPFGMIFARPGIVGEIRTNL